jgi:hypothetical protein
MMQMKLQKLPPMRIRSKPKASSCTRISEKQKINIEWLMFCMFICCALPWVLMDSKFFSKFIHALAPNFSIPDRSAFFPKHLAQEVAVWGEKWKEFLDETSHNTISLMAGVPAKR